MIDDRFDRLVMEFLGPLFADFFILPVGRIEFFGTDPVTGSILRCLVHGLQTS